MTATAAITEATTKPSAMNTSGFALRRGGSRGARGGAATSAVAGRCKYELVLQNGQRTTVWPSSRSTAAPHTGQVMGTSNRPILRKERQEIFAIETGRRAAFSERGFGEGALVLLERKDAF